MSALTLAEGAEVGASVEFASGANQSRTVSARVYVDGEIFEERGETSSNGALTRIELAFVVPGEL